MTSDLEDRLAIGDLLVCCALPPGRYECEAVKKGGTWRFRRRVVFHDHDYTLEGI